jgi:hypothetical protein
MRVKAWLTGLSARKNYVLASLLLLLPCYWQPRLQASDLSNLIYSGWLVRLVESGRGQGMAVTCRWTNVLFDFILSGLFRAVGPEAAQRISVSLAVLTFAWGAFAFVSVVSGKRPWHLMPSIAMLAYGWVFHMGFFDFYLSMGLCFWALALAWETKPWRVAAALPIFLLAYLSHALPVVWTCGLLIYISLARQLTPKLRSALTANFVLAMVVFHLLATRLMSVEAAQAPRPGVSGDPGTVFGPEYGLVLMGLAAVWSALFVGLVRGSGARQVVTGLPFQVCLVSAAMVFALPITLLLPDFYYALGFVGERMSLGVAACVCALLGAARPRRIERWALLAVAIVFFALVYRGQRALNLREDQMEDVVAQTVPSRIHQKPGIEEAASPNAWPAADFHRSRSAARRADHTLLPL